jgi:predicted PhzF superfamily epimerase YddE/YHI9
VLDLGYRHVDVFSRRALQGNGLVVVLDAENLGTGGSVAQGRDPDPRRGRVGGRGHGQLHPVLPVVSTGLPYLIVPVATGRFHADLTRPPSSDVPGRDEG